MKRIIILLTTAAVVSTLLACAQHRGMVSGAEKLVQSMAGAGEERNRPLIMVHYMPWYEAPPLRDGYGWHWHMGSFEPYRSGEEGYPMIASHHMPLTGPYDSSDKDILEYQSLLMIMSGIDGVIADWYGIRDALDYRSIHESTRKLFSTMARAGLLFSVCYEDQTMIKMVEGGSLPYSETLAHGKEVMAWLDSHWFLSDTYLKINGKPVVLNFGPQFFTLRSQWDEMFEGLTNPPALIALDGHMERDADGLFPWPPMHRSEGGVLSPETALAYLVRFYGENKGRENLVATAFPGFHDIYSEAGVGRSYGYLDSLDGETFRLTLEAADRSGASVIQVATWNDYGEGTGIEPTVEQGYTYLEELQSLRKRYDREFPFGPKDLRIPLQILRLRREKSGDRALMKSLDELFKAAAAMDRRTYRSIARDLDLRFSLRTADMIDRSRSLEESGSGEATETIEGTNLALGASNRDNGHVYEFISNNAVDGDRETYWEGAQDSYPNELIVDLKEEKKIKALRISLNPKRIWAARNMGIAIAWAGESGNYSEAVPLKDYTFDPLSKGNAVTIGLEGECRYIKVTGWSNSEARALQIAELEVY